MHYLNKITVLTFLILNQTNVYGQENNSKGVNFKSKASIVNDDNIYRVQNNLKSSDTYLRIEPDLSATGGLGKHKFNLVYKGDYAKFRNYSDASFYDHAITGAIKLEHSYKFRSEVNAGFKKDHEEPGSINRVQLDITEYNKFDEHFFSLGLTYGSYESIGRINLDYIKNTKNYNNNNLDFLDNTNDQYSVKFTYRIAPNTKIYLETVLSDIDYTDHSNIPLDNKFIRYRAGVTWDISEKLSGDINLGYQNRDYDNSLIDDLSGLAFDGRVNWTINTYTGLTFRGKRESIDSSLDEAGGIIRTSFGLDLKHEISRRLFFDFGLAYATDELVFSERNDDRYVANLGLDYELNNRIKIGSKYFYEERKSTLEFAEYSANIIEINMTIELNK